MIVKDIRKTFQKLYLNNNFVIDKSGVKTLEIIGASFIANEPLIFGKENKDYIDRELKWYLSQSLNVNDIPGKVPEIWKVVATPNGEINSNYGYLILSEENGFQYLNVLNKLVESYYTRQAVMVYTRPTIHIDATRDGMNDFICTNAVQYLIRDEKLDVIVQMRSNDAVFGYKNDLAWQKYVQEFLVKEINESPKCALTTLRPGNIHWQVGSLHLYERHFNLLDC